MNKTIFGIGVIFGVLAISLGAFGAHGLKSVLDTAALSSFETGVTYQMYHALVLLIVAIIPGFPKVEKRKIGIVFTVGVVLFSFSIYLLATASVTGFSVSSIALVTPLGGMVLIIGWLLLGYRVFKHFS